ncbi:hypothetical protein M23134_02661 [Microscilla marina ATCC 23134]|uniref:DUF983 domain-containing protein n=2 Tax=Microscilla marina TaxID=1027 RepID=A1ZNV3_MICM2|nr:hypothetical protein M23134_02661 [Microscilla marina ATCC 23134]
MIKGNCPHCQQGKVFTHRQFYHPTRFSDMHEKCAHCGGSFLPEPGFYVGAMYVSYALAIPVAFLLAMGLYYGAGVSDVSAMVAMIVGIVLFTPINFRLSRLIWLYLFGTAKKYQEKPTINMSKDQSYSSSHQAN